MSDLDDAKLWLSRAGHDGDVIEEELDRLTAAIATWKEEEEAWKETEACLLARVEELEKEKHPEISVTAGSGGIALYVNGERRPITPHALDGAGHRFTPEMIDAAAAFAEEFSCWGPLNELNIYRCKHPTCENGTIPGPSLGRVKHTGCTGHGWTIGEGEEANVEDKD